MKTRRTAKKQTSFRNDILDVYRRLFRFSSDITAGGDDDERVGFAVRVLDVKPAKEDDSCRDHALSEIQLLAELCDDCLVCLDAEWARDF
jgi:hypothetical protein